jgi:hypothetical protein
MSVQIPQQNQIEESIMELFEKVKMLDRIILWRAIIPNDPALDKFAPEGKRATSYIPLYEWQELKMFVWSFKKLLKNVKTDKGLQLRIMMIVYCHIFEADFPFALIWNLLRGLKGLPESWIFTKKNKKGNLDVCEYPSQKIREIQNLSNEQGLSVGDILHSLWSAELRNNFSHSQYSITDDAIFFTKDISPISRRPLEGMPHGKAELKNQDLKKYYNGACTLIDVFDQEYRNIYKKATLTEQG